MKEGKKPTFCTHIVHISNFIFMVTEGNINNNQQHQEQHRRLHPCWLFTKRQYATETVTQSSFPVVDKVDNVGIFVQLPM